MLTIFGYDDHGRVIRKLEIGLGHNATMTETTYNFVGDVTGETVTYYAYNEASGSVSPTVYASTTNKYDIPHTKLLGSSVITIMKMAVYNYGEDKAFGLFHKGQVKAMSNNKAVKEARFNSKYK